MSVQEPVKSDQGRQQQRPNPPTHSDQTSEVQFQLSPSVRGAFSSLPRNEKIAATSFVNAILDRAGHRKEYAAGAFAQMELSPTPARFTSQEWLDEILTLFDPEEFIAVSDNPRPQPKLHGQLAILALCLLEEPLRQQLESEGIFSRLEDALTPSVTGFFTERGHFLYAHRYEPADRVPIWPDDPIGTPEQDLLGRSYFAEYVADRIGSIPPASGAYPIHLYAPWGAGKGSLLNMVKNKLEQKDSRKTEGWTVVEFNAW